MASYSWRPGERRRNAVLAVVTAALMLSPLRQYRRAAGDRVDSFPLSHYPMFSKRRGRHTKVNYAVGVRADGSTFPLPLALLGSGGFNQVRHQLNRIVRQGRADAYAHTLAARLAEDSNHRDLVRVDIVRGRFDLDACMLTRRIEGTGQVEVVGSAPGPQTPQYGTSADHRSPG
jgi:hypothetical protein